MVSQTLIAPIRNIYTSNLFPIFWYPKLCNSTFVLSGFLFCRIYLNYLNYIRIGYIMNTLKMSFSSRFLAKTCPSPLPVDRFVYLGKKEPEEQQQQRHKEYLIRCAFGFKVSTSPEATTKKSHKPRFLGSAFERRYI